MTPESPPPTGNAPERARASSTRPLIAGAVVALAGIALAASLSWLHLELDASGGAYTSFCNVNETVNCDRVLNSSFSKLAGIPVANLALLAYGALAIGLLAAAASDLGRRVRLVRIVAIATVGAVVFSVYMAVVSFFVLGTVCLMCSGLYLVAIGVLVSVIVASRRLAVETGRPALSPGAASVTAVASLAAVAVVAMASRPAPSTAGLTAEQIRTEQPEFYEWYMGLPVSTVPRSSDRNNTSGPADAPVTIVEFFDFECGHCRRNHERLTALRERRPDDVRVVYRHFPLDPSCNEVVAEPIHVRACRAAEAAECAGRQAMFTEMADAMFVRQTQLFESNLPRIAELAGLDVEAFRECMDDRAALKQVIADCRAGAKLDLKSTPTMFFNGRRIEGSINQQDGYDMAVTLEAAASVEPEKGG